MASFSRNAWPDWPEYAVITTTRVLPPESRTKPADSAEESVGKRLPRWFTGLLLATGSGSLCGMLAGVAFPVIFVNLAGLSLGAYGVMMSLNAVGIIGVGVHLALRPQTRISISYVYLGMTAVACAMLTIGLTGNLWLCALALLVGGMGNGASEITFSTLIQSKLSSTDVPVAFGLSNAWGRAGQLLGLLLTSVMVMRFPMRVVLLSGAVGYGVAIGFGVWRARGDTRESPPGLPAVQ